MARKSSTRTAPELAIGSSLSVDGREGIIYALNERIIHYRYPYYGGGLACGCIERPSYAVTMVHEADVVYFSADCTWRFEEDGDIVAEVANPRSRSGIAYALWSAINVAVDDLVGDFAHRHADYGTPYRKPSVTA